VVRKEKVGVKLGWRQRRALLGARKRLYFYAIMYPGAGATTLPVGSSAQVYSLVIRIKPSNASDCAF
jgi:hypothetical protein